MNVAAVIALLLEVFGPLLSELLKKWLSTKLNQAAKDLDFAMKAEITPSLAVQSGESLIDKALSSTPRRQLLRRSLLRKIKEATPTVIRTKKLSQADQNEIRMLARVADTIDM